MFLDHRHPVIKQRVGCFDLVYQPPQAGAVANGGTNNDLGVTCHCVVYLCNSDYLSPPGDHQLQCLVTTYFSKYVWYVRKKIRCRAGQDRCRGSGTAVRSVEGLDSIA